MKKRRSAPCAFAIVKGNQLNAWHLAWVRAHAATAIAGDFNLITIKVDNRSFNTLALLARMHATIYLHHSYSVNQEADC